MSRAESQTYLLDPSFGQSVDLPVDQAQGLPNEAYTSHAFFEYERDNLFAKTWSCVGVACDLPDPGDAKPISFMGLPLFMLRDRSGGIRVFHNVCSHRGLEIIGAPCKIKSNMLRCPYHSWVYDFEGELRRTPMIGGPGADNCDGFSKAGKGLSQVRSAVWLDMIFINLSGDAPAFEDHMAPLMERWSHYDFSLLRHGGADSAWRIEMDANWKLPVENHCDAYHLPWVHPELNRISRFEDHYPLLNEDLFAGQGSRAYNGEIPEGAPSLPFFPGLDEVQRKTAEYVSIYPNATVGVHGNHIWTVWFEVVAPDRTVERMEIYYVGEEPLGDDHKSTREKVHADWLQVWREDLWVVESMQRGRSSPAFQGGVFSPVLDQPVHNLHRWVTRQLAGDRGSRVAAE